MYATSPAHLSPRSGHLRSKCLELPTTPKSDLDRTYKTLCPANLSISLSSEFVGRHSAFNSQEKLSYQVPPLLLPLHQATALPPSRTPSIKANSQLAIASPDTPPKIDIFRFLIKDLRLIRLIPTLLFGCQTPATICNIKHLIHHWSFGLD